MSTCKHGMEWDQCGFCKEFDEAMAKAVASRKKSTKRETTSMPGNLDALEKARKNLADKRADGTVKKPARRAPVDILLRETRRKITEAIEAEGQDKRGAIAEAQSLIAASLMLVPPPA